jgi:hypothetical protein
LVSPRRACIARCPVPACRTGPLSWDLHAIVGVTVGLPVLVLAGGALGLARLRGFGWWAGLTLILYLTQVGLATADTGALAFHPFTGALLLTSALVLLAKVERRRAHHS